MSESLDSLLGRMGYVRADTAGKDLAVPEQQTSAPAGEVEQPAYPQVVMIQGRSTGESWVRDHAGQILLAAGVGVFGLAALAVVALVAILVTVAMVTCTTALVVARAAASGGRGGGRRGR